MPRWPHLAVGCWDVGTTQVPPGDVITERLRTAHLAMQGVVLHGYWHLVGWSTRLKEAAVLTVEDDDLHSVRGSGRFPRDGKPTDFTCPRFASSPSETR